MGNLFVYSVMSSLILASLYLPYRLFLSHMKQPSLNRMVLLSIIALSLLTPLFLYIVPSWAGASKEGWSVVAGVLEIQDVIATDSNYPKFDYAALATIIYLAGVTVMLLITASSLISLTGIIRHTSKATLFGIRVRRSDEPGIGPFSILGIIIIPSVVSASEIGPILAHEKSHVDHRHHLDLILVHCIKIFQWFNPAAWLMVIDLKDVHEYQADTDTLSKGYDLRAYQRLLLSQAVGSQNIMLTHNLNHNNLKKRIIMMNSKTAAGLRRLRLLLLAPTFAATVAIMSVPTVAGVFESISSVTASQIAAEAHALASDAAAPVTQAGGDVYYTAEKLPEYPGGEAAMMKRLNEVLHYPEEAYKNNISGRVVVRFVVDATGNVTDPEVIKSVSPALDEAAKEAVLKLDRFTPGELKGHPVKVYYVLPILFKTQGKAVDDAGEKKLKVADSSNGKAPEYPGGEKFMMEHLNRLVKYPESALKEGRQGRVVVEFTVNEQGKIIDPTVTRPVAPDLDKAAVDAVEKLGYFEPGEIDGKPASIRMTLPVEFRLSSGNAEKASSNKIITLDELNNLEAPAYFINGQEVTQKEAMDLSSAEIASISIIKNNKDYPNGMVIIMTK